MLFVSIYGGAVVRIRDGSFYQTIYPDCIPETVPVGRVIGPGGIHFGIASQIISKSYLFPVSNSDTST